MERGQLPELIKDLLVEHHLLSASDIVDKLAKAGHKYNKTSVYRALDKMIDEDLLCRQRLVDHQVWYELRDDHIHLVCEKCGKVQSIENTMKLPSEIGDFQVAHHHITLYGKCHECQ